MRDNYDEIAFKAVTYPILDKLQKRVDELWVYQMKDDCEDNFNFLIEWIEKLDDVSRTARKSIDEYVASLGYQVIDKPAPDQ